MLMAKGHSGDRCKIMMVGDRFDTDVRAGLSAGFRTCLVLTGCHNLDCQRFYRADPADFYASSIGGLIPPGALQPPGDIVPPPSPATPVAGANPAMALEHWVLMQGSMLTPGRADQSRVGLREALRPFFDQCDADANGFIDEAELRGAFETMGMGGRVRAASSGGSTAGTPASTRTSASDAEPRFGDDAMGALPGTPLSRRPAEHIPSKLSSLLAADRSSVFGALFNRAPDAPELRLDFNEFSVVIEEALAECGVEARRKWQKLKGLGKMSIFARTARTAT